MADNPGSGNVLNFPRLGFTLSPTPPAGPPPHTPTTPPDGTPSPADPASGGGRRSPLDIVNALPDPGPLQPLTALPGQTPDTFRSTPTGDHHDDAVGARLGALSLAAILAVAVAALRGTHTVLSDWRQRRLERAEEAAPLREARLKHQLAMQGLHDKADQQRAKTNNKVPSSAEFGRKTAGGRGNGGSGGGKGGGSGSGSSRKSGPSGSSGSGSTGPGRKKNPGTGPGSTRKNGGSGAGKGLGGGKGPGGRKTPAVPKPKTPKSPHRGSQGAGSALQKAKTRNNRPDSGKTRKDKNAGRSDNRTPLSAALTKSAQKTAARRLKRRRKNNPATPALWKNQPNVKSNKPGKGPGKSKTGPQNHAPGANTKKTPGQSRRTTLNQALRKTAQKAAARRWKRRQKQAGPTPPIWTAPKNGKTNGGAGGSGTGKPTARPKKGRKNRGTNTGWWGRARAYTRKKASNGGCFGGPGTTRPGPGAGTSGGTNGGPRNTPFGNAGQAQGTTYTAQRADYPGAQARRWEPDALTTGTPALPSTGPAALAGAPVPHSARPGTTRPKDPIAMPPVPATRDPRIRAARKAAARAAAHTVSEHMDSQHATEITLDDALDQYGDFKDDAFKTHDKCLKLAARARELRDTLATFAVELAVKHNLIGALFAGAMARLSESMELLARMADEMQVSSLEAAEMAETADNDLNDAYRPYSTATADAGLSTPSAPIHNET